MERDESQAKPAPAFVRGIELSRRFFAEAVRPILEERYPRLLYAAAIVGAGSDVLGFDNEMSTDHYWGPSTQILLRDKDTAIADEIRETLRHTLPHVFCGYPVNQADSPFEAGTPVMTLTSEGPVNHRIFPMTLRAFVQDHLAWDIDQPLEPADWLSFASQQLRSFTGGAVHHDACGDLTALRQQLSWYPHDVWLYLLACGWRRIAQEEHLMPRAGYVGDELGSAIIGSRLVRDIMSLCFLMERQYAPYPKWFGTAFQELKCSDDLLPVLEEAKFAKTWKEREERLTVAYTYVVRMHNGLGITPQIDDKPRQFFGRPFQVIFADRVNEAIQEVITDPAVKRLTKRPMIGSIDQWSDSTDIRSCHRDWRLRIRTFYE